ncbi:DNA ligase D [Piscinibacter sp.]|uniref:DNA ligase D n=1 Tax=Piscinibacter sp. TaxID=1903157 RepID=UPI002C9896A4|nr:DNA ligase D [Albitalea sp.]HUG24787.1 DNA ligase D [Albitalea sp.]
MTDRLNRYWQKRDFDATPEPKGKPARSGKALSFVVQKHAARRLHYDFRLELDGTLKSWAVPKGPSLDPNDKRMAVHVEDHPLSYGGFEGAIPPGQYGAGTVIVWDRGTWEPIGDPRDGYAQGKLKLRLQGDKLSGAWTLVRMHGRSGERQEPWLLIKERDEHARPASDFSVVDEMPDSVLSGTRRSAGAKTAGGTPEFNALQNAFDSARTEQIQYYLFDIPFYGGHDLREAALVDRRALLHGVMQDAPSQRVRLSFSEWTPDGRVRHAIFHGLRDDKPASTITKETPQPTTKVAAKKAGGPTSTKKAARDDASVAMPALPKDLRISNPQRVIDTTAGLTKRDLVNHYLLAARRMLPHLAGRPLALVRAPSGIAGKHFFQKHGETLKIGGLKHLDSALDPGHPPLMMIDSFDALIGAAQMNVIEFHTWNATVKNIEKPDRMTFDLDPGEGVEWRAVQEAAELVRALLEELGLASFLKTSGGKGLHVVVPLTPRDDWDAVKDFSQAVVQHLANVLPDRFVAKSGPKNRAGKIFADYLRNGRGATTVAAYSARARAGLGVSIPCAWDELQELTSGAHWTLANAHERLESGEDPWAGYTKTRQTLTRAKKALGSVRQR